MLSEQIMKDRAGNFTASANNRLMAGWDIPEPDTYFEEFDELYSIMHALPTKPLVGAFKELILSFKVTGSLINKVWSYMQWKKVPEGLITYAKEKACELLFDYDPSLNFQTVHTKNGNERELDCVLELIDKTGINFVNIGEDQAHICTNETGATPDGIVLDEFDMVLTGCEVKCKSPFEHAKLLLINNNEDLLRDSPEFYCQIQTQMFVTGSDHWYFAIYNPYGKTEAVKFKYIIIGRDDIYIKALEKRLEIAKKIKADYLIELQNSIKGGKPTTIEAEQSLLK
jgi:hypothetical protein